MSDGVEEADRSGTLPHPREVYGLFGLDAPARRVEKAFASGRMHHAWMITGPKGSGKASLAWHIARRVLGAKPGEGTAPLSSLREDPVCQKLEALSHPDLLLIRRPWNEKTKKLRAEITVEEARKAPAFFSRSAADGGWRVVIVDCADELNINAANALLKILEEPPKRGLLLLVVHSPGQILPTLRSRCRRLSLRPPAPEQTADWLVSRHDIAPDLAEAVSTLAGGAPGRALALLETDAPSFKQSLDQVLGALPKLDHGSVMKIADGAARKGGDALKVTVLEFLVQFSQAKARQIALEQGGHASVKAWVHAADALTRLSRESQALYLDPKQTLFAAFSLIEEAASA